MFMLSKFHMNSVKFKHYNTVNDKSFGGEKFRDLLGSSGMWGKIS